MNLTFTIMSILKLTIPPRSTQKVWITSDTHYGHHNIVRGITNWKDEEGNIRSNTVRDFNTLDHMNDTIVNNINNVVGEDDILIHGGDWSFGGFDKVREFRNRIFCKNIHIIPGNHDHWIQRNRDGIQELFTSVRDYMSLQLNNDTIEILHYPMASWNGLNRGHIHLHGHCHLKNDVKIFGRRMDIGMDGHLNFRPYDIIRECIIPLMKNEIKSGLGQLDRHIEKNEI